MTKIVSLQEIHEMLRNHGFELISEYSRMKKSVKVKCYCSNIFECLPVDIKRGRKKSCGCHIKVGPENDYSNMKFGDLLVVKYIDKFTKSGKKHYFWECICKCGKIINLSPTHLIKKHKNCKKCTAKKGKDNPNYKGNNIYLERNKLKFIRPKIFERDNFTCKVCCRDHVYLNAHHLNGWDKFPEQRFDENNIITMCKCCHDVFHKIYGKGKNTNEQFQDFLNTYVV